MSKPMSTSRRRFLEAAACTAAYGGFSALNPQLSMLGTALAQTSITGYKALVCLYMDGGCDSFNLLMPTNPARHDEYITARGGLYTGNSAALAYPRVGGDQPAGSLAPILPLTGVEYGVNPNCTGLKELYDMGRLAFISNVAPLIEPVTRATFNTRRRPPQLYSHSDQTALWEIGPTNNSRVLKGWGGMLAGRIGAESALTGLPPTISLSGNSRFLVGEEFGSGVAITPYRLSTSNNSPAVTLGNYANNTSSNFQQERRRALDALLGETYPQVFSNETGDILERSMRLGTSVNTLIGTGGQYNAIPGGVTFPTNGVGPQLAQVVRMINASKNSTVIGANRQIFYVRVGGFDTHDGQVNNLANLLSGVSASVNAFYRALVAAGLHNDVMLFSASDFGRTINSNGNGTDHAWGGIQFIVGGGQGVNAAIAGDQGGGPLRGRNPETGTGSGMYGRYPRIVLNATDSAAVPDAEKGESFSRGQFLPTTSSEQVSATLARWMGLDDSNVPTLFTNIDRFDDFSVAQGNLMAYTGRYVPFLQGII
jgi:uncharacterized protein (DUF1501 family)